MFIAPFKAWVMIFRVQAVMVWAILTVSVSTAWAGLEGVSINWVNMLLTAAIASITQGFPAHIVNEIYDWKSGTDKAFASGKISGGSKVLQTGLIDVAGLWRMFAVTSFFDLLLVCILYYRTQSLTLVLIFGIGYLVCVFYTLPPLSLAYRPFAGEWLGGFTGVVLNMTGSYYVQTGQFSASMVSFAVVLGMLYVSIMILFHYIDHDNDAAAVPRKTTTIVFLGLDQSRIYNLTVAGAAAVLSALLAWRFGRIFLVMTTALIFHWFFQYRCDPFDTRSVVANGKKITLVVLVFGVVFSVLSDVTFLFLIPVFVAGFVLHRKFGKVPRVTT